MRALLDVNVLIALLDADHVAHALAIDWFGRHGREGWASCPITQNGCLRVMAHSSYATPRPLVEIAERLAEATSDPLHEFWPDDASALDGSLIDLRRVHGTRQLTDVYLLALAVAHGGRFVTFDRAITRSAVAGASPAHLVVL